MDQGVTNIPNGVELLVGISVTSLIIQIGQIWRVKIRWADSDNTVEERPAVIVGWSQFSNRDDQIILVSSITSHGDGGISRLGEIKIPNPDKYSLSPNSHIRARQITSIHPNLLTPANGPIATLDPSMTIETLTEISKMFTVTGFVKVR